MTKITATYVDHMGSDLSVVNAARVSFGKKSEWEFEGLQEGLLEKDKKLIKFLASYGHISPFGHCFASFHVKAPVFVARQLVKHKFLRWNEISRRYVDDEPEFYTPDVWRGKAQDKKQGSSDKEIKNIHADTTLDYVKSLYNHMLSEGVAPEQARMVLPQSTMTEWYWSGSLDAFAAMAKLRCASDTQAETQEVAWQIYHKMEDLFPVSWVALMEDAY